MSEDKCIFILKNWFLDNVYKENNNDLNNINDLESINFVKAIETILDLYQQEKEKNKALENKNASLNKEIKLMKSVNINDNYISKDKIKAKIKEIEGQEDWYIENKSLDDLYGRIDELKELLEENQI